MTYASWRPTPKGNYRKPDPAEGSAVLTSRAAAIADALRPEDCERIKAEAAEAAAEALAAWEGKQTGRSSHSARTGP